MPGKKFDILSRSIAQDQAAVAKQWADTLIHNSKDDTAVNMTQLLLACLARGDFKTRAFLSKSPALQVPSDKLSITDYISHASRIILDYQGLTETNRQELLSYFPSPRVKDTVFSRSATHNVSRNMEGAAVEGKGVLLGIMGQLPGIIKTPQDFGINIAMGGMGQTNFYDKKISDNGCSGHFYFHRNDSDSLLLLGLEQTAPAASALEFLLGAKKYPDEVQQHHDQFGQGHSLTGASDTYTAAGSLYFSDPVYQTKLLLEKGVFPPDKYGAMHITITEENWPLIKLFFNKLKTTAHSDEDQKEQQLLELLLSKPVTASPAKEDYLSYIALDFDTYLKRVYQIFIAESQLDAGKQPVLFNLQAQLLVTIKKLQQGHIEHYETFKLQVAEIIHTKDTPPEYQEAILRIQELFKLQLKIDPKLKQTHEELLLKNIYDDLQEESKVILEKLLEIQKHFQELPPKELESLEPFLLQIDKHIRALQNPFSPQLEAVDLSASWVMCDYPIAITMDSIDRLKQAVESAKLFIKPITLTGDNALSFSTLLLGWEEKFLPFAQINLIDYSELNLSNLAKQFNEYVHAVARQAEQYNYWDHKPSQTTNIFSDFFTQHPERELGATFVGQYRESTILRRLFFLDTNLSPLGLKPYEELNAEYLKHHPNPYWCKTNELLTAGTEVITNLHTLKAKQSTKASWEDMSATFILFQEAIARFKKANEELNRLRSTAKMAPAEVFESPFFYAINDDEVLGNMNGAQLATICLEELNAISPSALVKRITSRQDLWQLVEQELPNDEFKNRNDFEKKVITLRQIRYFGELARQFKDNTDLQTKEGIFVKLRNVATESSAIFEATQDIENAQTDLRRLQAYMLQRNNLATAEDKFAALNLLEEQYHNLPQNERNQYAPQLIQAQKNAYQFYLAKINASQDIEERKTIFSILNQLFRKLPLDSRKQLQVEYDARQIEDTLYGFYDRFKRATSVPDKKLVFVNPMYSRAVEDFERNSALSSACGKRIHRQLTRAQLIYEKLLNTQIINEQSPVKPLDTLLEQFTPILDRLDVPLQNQLIAAALNDDILRQAILKKVENKKFSPVLIKDLLTLKAFREAKIALSKEQKYGDEYDQSINQFYEKALTIRMSGHPAQNQAHDLMKAAKAEFNHRHDTHRLIADIVMIVTAFFGIGILVGLARIGEGNTLFFSSAKTDREVEFQNQWLCKPQQLPPTEESETQLLIAPVA